MLPKHKRHFTTFENSLLLLPYPSLVLFINYWLSRHTAQGGSRKLFNVVKFCLRLERKLDIFWKVFIVLAQMVIFVLYIYIYFFFFITVTRNGGMRIWTLVFLIKETRSWRLFRRFFSFYFLVLQAKFLPKKKKIFVWLNNLFWLLIEIFNTFNWHCYFIIFINKIKNKYFAHSKLYQCLCKVVISN